VDTARQIPDLLVDDLHRRSNEKPRPFEPLFLELRQDFSDLPPASPLVVAVVAFGKLAQAGDERSPIRQPVTADATGDRWSHDLLGAAADAEEKFEVARSTKRPR